MGNVVVAIDEITLPYRQTILGNSRLPHKVRRISARPTHMGRQPVPGIDFQTRMVSDHDFAVPVESEGHMNRAQTLATTFVISMPDHWLDQQPMGFHKAQMCPEAACSRVPRPKRNLSSPNLVAFLPFQDQIADHSFCAFSCSNRPFTHSVTFASIASDKRLRAPARKTAVNRSSTSPGWDSRTTVLSFMANRFAPGTRPAIHHQDASLPSMHDQSLSLTAQLD